MDPCMIGVIFITVITIIITIITIMITIITSIIMENHMEKKMGNETDLGVI